MEVVTIVKLYVWTTAKQSVQQSVKQRAMGHVKHHAQAPQLVLHLVPIAVIPVKGIAKVQLKVEVVLIVLLLAQIHVRLKHHKLVEDAAIHAKQDVVVSAIGPVVVHVTNNVRAIV